MSRNHKHNELQPTRRDLLLTGSAALAATALGCKSETTSKVAAASAIAFHPHGTETLRVGLIGCGGRGTGAAAQALNADPNVELVAMGDAFGDYIDNALAELTKQPFASRVKVDPEHKFVGFDAYKRVIDASDVVLFATSPHFRPLHVSYAVEKGKHMFVEKPVATDAPGLRSMIESCKIAKAKKIALVSGLCYRYERKKQQVIQRIHDGAIGDIVGAQCTYNTEGLWHRGRQPEWSDMEWQMRNWLYFTWLSGDHIVEQHIHSLDKIAWAMGDKYPVKVTSSGGRSQRTDPKYGNIYDHFNTVYEWDNGVKCFSSCRQWVGASTDVSDHVFGTKGVAHIQSHAIEGANAWRWRKASEDEPNEDMYQNEHDALFASIRKGEPIYNGDYMCSSTLMAIMGRMAAYAGQTITLEQALNSQENLAPQSYEWTSMPVAAVAVPGVTKFT